MKNTNPDAVFHLAANASTRTCEEKPEETRKLNVDASAKIAEMCADHKSRLIFCSSEQVYAGIAEEYSENDTPEPGNEYGKQKLAAERKILEIYPDAAVARIAVLYGWSKSHSKGFLSEWLETWKNDRAVMAFHDEWRCFLSTRSAIEGLTILLEQGASGVFNVGGADLVSRFDFAASLKFVFDVKLPMIKMESLKNVDTGSYRPPRLNLNLEKIKSIGFKPRHLQSELAIIAQEMIL
jgi:dTDP-4-dehydrorhamnose reductase